jgi:hypothetical protein
MYRILGKKERNIKLIFKKQNMCVYYVCIYISEQPRSEKQNFYLYLRTSHGILKNEKKT